MPNTLRAMNFLQNMKRNIVLTLFAILLLDGFMLAHDAHAVTVRMKKGTESSGYGHSDWHVYLRKLHSEEKARELVEIDRPYTEEEKKWIDFVKHRMVAFINQLNTIEKRYKGINPPDDISIIVGNRGGEKARHCKKFTICLDLQKWSEAYVSPNAEAAKEMDNLLVQEYQDILQKIAPRQLANQ